MPLAPPVIKIVLLVSSRIKYPPNYLTIYKVARKLSFAVEKIGVLDIFNRRNRYGAYPLSGCAASTCSSGLAGEPFTKQFRLQLPRKRRGHEGVHDAVQPAWNDFGAVFAQTTEGLGYALLHAHRFHRHGLRIEAELFEHRCVRKPGCQYSDVDT